MKKLFVLLLFAAAPIFAQAASVYVTVIDSAKQNGGTVTLHWHINKDGVKSFDRTVSYIANSGETAVQLRTRIIAAEKGVRDAEIESEKAADLVESTNSDVSAALNGITQ